MKKPHKNNSHIGCGNTLGITKINKGDTVLVIGSGDGTDCFLASKKVGDHGRVIGIDVNQNMVDEAQKTSEKLGCNNVEFRLGRLEDLPIRRNSIDVIISHCVINLVPDKGRAYKEIRRVLKKGGKMYISDIVVLRNISKTEKNALPKMIA